MGVPGEGPSEGVGGLAPEGGDRCGDKEPEGREGHAEAAPGRE